MIDSETIYRCTHNNLSFPEAVNCLSQVGVERYYTDLIRMEKVFYSKHGDSYLERMSIDSMPKIAENFDANKIKDAIKTIQQNSIDYSAFIKRIADAGVANYVVYIDGKHVSYVGRKGECHIEQFPDVSK